VDAFSYLSVLLSIILGLGLTQLLTAAGRLIRHRDRVRLDWLPLLWAAVLLVIYVQSWWAMFGLRNVRKWTFVAFLAVLAQTTTLYMMAAVVLPEQVEDAGVDLAEHYERQR
jgi:cellulose synthase/poly-beta-1,6-N-acetylglucosamine synthase-like glycosyltransferase